MAGEIFRRSFPEAIDQVRDDSSSSSELHVLAVDDSLVDRKVIERLLKISSCKGIYIWAVDDSVDAVFGLKKWKKDLGFDWFFEAWFLMIL